MKWHIGLFLGLSLVFGASVSQGEVQMRVHRGGRATVPFNVADIDSLTFRDAIGSCCASDSTCTQTTQSACPGAWTGNGVCTPNPCMEPGACCDTATGACTVTTGVSCIGNWTQAGVCVPNLCPQPTGACCNTVTGDCRVTTEAICTGAWTEAGVCVPNTCPRPTGACCDPATGACTVATAASCTGTWTLAGLCVPNTCPVPTGACCNTATGACTITTQAACTFSWLGTGVTCNMVTCPVPPPVTVWIPPGNARLGQTGIAEPVNDFYVGSFYIDIYEVSNAKYKAFIDAGGYTTEVYWNPVGWAWRVAGGYTLPAYWNNTNRHGGGIAGNEQFPVIGVSWWEADAYCRWAGGRLPTEAEWEKAAKGGCEMHGDPGQCDATDTPTYPWGEGFTGQQANYLGSGDPYDNDNGGEGNTTPVGYYDGSNHGGYQTIDSPSPYGLYDVAGNVWEWCSTKFAAYPYNPNDGRENPPVSYSECCRVLRGGSYLDSDDDYLRSAGRYDGGNPNGRYYNIGFRCVRTG
jgi:formylglycine-generating enzyme required for sulfatase activity